MSRKKSSILLSLVILLSLCGCSVTSEKSKPSFGENESNISNPFEGNDNSESKPISYEVSYGFGLRGNEAEFTSKNSLQIPMLLKGDNTSADIGVMVYVDGILQEFSTENSAEYSVMGKFVTPENAEKTVPINVNARFDKVLKTHSINGISILYPDFYPQSDNPFFGNNHKGLSGSCTYFSTNDEEISFADGLQIYEAESPTVISSDKKEQYNIRENAWDTINILQSENDSHTFVIDESNGRLDLTFSLFSMASGITDYRVSFYKNHELVKFNGKYDYLDVTAEGGKITEVNIALDNISVGDFVYCVAVPLKSTHEYVYPIKTDSVMIVDSDLNFSQNKSNESTETSSENHSAQNQSVLQTCDDGIIYQISDENGLGIGFSATGTDISKTLNLEASDGYIISAMAHGETISIMYSDFITTKGIILDKELNIVKSIDLQEFMRKNRIDSYENIDITLEGIYFVDRDMRLFRHDWGNDENEHIMDSDFEGIFGAGFTSIKKVEDYIAFSANSDVNGTTADYFGVIRDNGKYEIHRKDGIASPQTLGNITIWADAHVQPGEKTSGEIILYKDGRFETLKTENSMESAYAVLCGETIVTQLSNIVIKQLPDQTGAEIGVYDCENKTKIRKISISNYAFPSIPKVAFWNGNVITSVMDSGATKSITIDTGR